MISNFFSLAGIETSFRLADIHSPVKVGIILTEKCNLSCIFCATECGFDQNSYNDIISPNMCYEILDQAHKNRVQEIIYSGGEPLMYKFDDLINILEYGRERKLKQTIISNGTLINDDNFPILENLVDVVSISLHGTKDTHNKITCSDEYENTLHTLMLVSNSKKISGSILYTLNSYNSNYQDFDHVVRLSKELNMELYVARGNDLGECSINESYPVLGNLNKIADRMTSYNNDGYNIKFSNCVPKCVLSTDNQYLATSCSAGVGICSISPRGEVRVCLQSDESLGVISNENSLSEIWQNKEIVNFRNMTNISPYCASCKDLMHCKSGCKLEANGIYQMDTMAKLKISEKWEEILGKKARINCRELKITKQLFWTISHPICKISINYLEVCKSLMKKRPVVLNEILNCSDEQISQKDIIMLLVFLYEHNLLKFYS
ncbi:MAG: radical SAM protein [Clostridiales bacterium]|nr:radical SAM protein [Clostridiales bacterium]